MPIAATDLFLPSVRCSFSWAQIICFNLSSFKVKFFITAQTLNGLTGFTELSIFKTYVDDFALYSLLKIFPNMLLML
jgi:hypothetical protein